MATVTFSSTPEVDSALVELSNGGRDRSSIIRDAVLLLARHARRERLRAEAEALASSETDRAALREVQQDMESLRAW
jgi:hypothetical protein